MGTMTMTMTMHMPLLPQWLRVVWAAALAVVLVLHVVHAVTMRGETRRWHVGHILMAAGMIAMYLLPQADFPDLYWGGVAVFGLLTISAGFFLVNAWMRTQRLSWVWLATTLDIAIMTYMSTPARQWAALLTYLVVAYLVVETLLWLTARIPDSGGPARAGAPAEQHTLDSTTSHGGVLILTRPIVALWHNRPESDVTTGVRLTLAVMSLSMAWMLIAMQNMQMSGAMAPGMHM